MIIRDKQDLRKCVKQCVRRAQVIETNASCMMISEQFGVENNLRRWAPEADSLQESFEAACAGSPFAARTSAFLAALNALQLPVHDLDKAECIVKGYDRETYLKAVLNAMNARKAVVFADAKTLENSEFTDGRLAQGLLIGDELFVPGRYGVDYEAAANQIVQWVREMNVHDISLEVFSEPALKYCLIPVCEDEGIVLHVHIRSEEQLRTMTGILNEYQGIRVIISAQREFEYALIDQAVSLSNALVRLGDIQSIPYALRMLGTRFIPYASCALLPEEMLGRWVLAKEALWQALYEAYLPLARAGYELTRERIEADVDMLLCGNYQTIHNV